MHDDYNDNGDVVYDDDNDIDDEILQLIKLLFICKMIFI